MSSGITSLTVNGKDVVECLLNGGTVFQKTATYEVLEYISNNRVARIITDYLPNPQTTLIIELAVTGAFMNYGTYGGNSSVFATPGDSGNASFSANFGGDKNQSRVFFVWNNLAYGYGGNVQQVSLGDEIFFRSTLVVSPDHFTWGSTSMSVGKKKTYNQNPLCLLGSRSLGGMTCYEALLWGAQIMEGDDMIRSYIPVRRITDGAVGVYETVTGQFLTSQDTDPFLAGPVTGEKIYARMSSEIN